MNLLRLAIAAIILVAFAEITVFARNALFHSDRPPASAVQLGYRGTGLYNVYNPRHLEQLREANQLPVSVPYPGEEGPKAGSVYENLKVLGDVSAGELTRLMVNITSWVAPAQGCAACHNLANFADDGLYTKVVARRMLQMVRHINADWTRHVHETGVTCYTCHRGRLVPPNVWFTNPGPEQAGGLAQMPAGKNHPSAAAAGAALPLDPFTPFLEGDKEIRVQSTTALREDNRRSIKQTQWTYALMMSMSQALGVNCDFCHNTRAFARWDMSPPQRLTAWHGIRMVRDLNNEYLNPLKTTLPKERLGQALDDAPKVNCATCHNGVYKPLFGVSMVRDFPELKGTPTREADAQ